MSRKVRQLRHARHGDRAETMRVLAEDLRRPRRKRGRSLFGMVAGPIAAVLIGGLAAAWEEGDLASVTAPLGLIGGNCNIKGNISFETDERIYHVPGQDHYDATRISRQHGERWFCSEQEARSAGWRKSRT